MKKVITWLVCIWSVANVTAQGDFNLELLAQREHANVETNDVWGYVAPDGTEYAVIGTEQDCRIYSLIDPSNPVLVQTISGAQSIWRDFKTNGEYIYQITQRGSDGLTIIDMTQAPEVITSSLYKGELTVDDETTTLETCHNIYIDTTQGIAYLAGCNIANGAVIMLDIATDPLNPIFIGPVGRRYSHDVVTKGDTLFSSEINEGNLGIYDISDKANPQVISRTSTSSNFTHNAWYSDDGQFVFTTDERGGSYVDAYDISELESPIRIDQYRPTENLAIIPHNTHYHDGFLVTSWYTEGVIILDANRPDNLIKVGQYDTFLPDGSGFSGCWGAYPFLPSGLVLASDLASGLFVFQPDYQRAAYLEGQVDDALTGSAINGAQIVLNDIDQNIELSRADGVFKTGTALTGTYEVTISHPDYITQTIEVELIQGEVFDLNVRLIQRGDIFTAGGFVVDIDGNPIPDAQLIFEGEFRKEETASEANGFYKSLFVMGTYDVYVAAWGFRGRRLTLDIEGEELEPIVLERGYEDDFFADLGWSVSGDARTGAWERAIPQGTFFNGANSNPDVDIDTDLNDYAYVTGNDNASVGSDDVDDGLTILTSPVINIEQFQNAIIELTPWFFNDGGNSAANDKMSIYVLLDETKTLIEEITHTQGEPGRWLDPVVIMVDSINRRAKEVRVQVEVSDDTAEGHLVEGGIDKFRLYEGPLPIYPPNQEEIEIIIAPNPSDGLFFVDLLTDQKATSFSIFDRSGRVIFIDNSPSENATLEVNLQNQLRSGLYFIEVTFESGVTSTGKVQIFN